MALYTNQREGDEMATKSETAVLAEYFNTADSPQGYQKRPLSEFAQELRALSAEDKTELATLAAAELGHQLKADGAAS
jgi:hypothetical protein